MQESHSQSSPPLNPTNNNNNMASSAPMPSRNTSATAASNNTSSNATVNQVSDGKRDALSGRTKSGKSFNPRNNAIGGAKPRQFPNPQKRGGYHGRMGNNRNLRTPQQHYRNCGDVTEADEFEVGSVFNAGSKKTNLNHLLNFQYESRGVTQFNNQRGKKYGRRNNNKNNYDVKPRYKKEHYLQANCQFVVKFGSNLSVFLTDPDTLVEWDLIEQVGLKTSGMPSCPICLSPPRAAKIAKCGHIYCWSCMLHYFALSDDDYRNCPICFDNIYKNDLKSVVSLLHSEVNTGNEIEMVLMRRERDSLFAVPVDNYQNDIEGRHPSIGQEMNSYSKILTAAPDEVCNVIIARERKELYDQFCEEKDEPEAIFIETAKKQLDEREQENLVNWNPESIGATASPIRRMEKIKQPEQDQSEVEKEVLEFESEISDLNRPRHASSSSDGGSSIDIDEIEDVGEILAEDLDISNVQSATSPTQSKSQAGVRKDTFYFYQSADGQAIFLHALNVQMLVQEYGSLENCPRKIKGTILEKDNTSMSEELRNKLRYLRHLPVTCAFEVCELQLNSSLVSKETVAKFQDQLDFRRRRRAKRQRDEKRREKRIQVENNKLLGKFPGAKVRIESSFHFPEVGSSGRLSSASPGLNRSSESLLSTSPALNDSFETSGVFSSSQEEGSSNVPSFANMLRQGAARPMKRSDTAPALVQTWPRPRRDSESEPEPEGYVPPPPKTSIGDALALALEKATSLKGNEKDQPSTGRKKGKKNKGTKILLTSAARPSI